MVKIELESDDYDILLIDTLNMLVKRCKIFDSYDQLKNGVLLYFDDCFTVTKVYINNWEYSEYSIDGSQEDCKGEILEKIYIPVMEKYRD